jgi:hypothetical protein
VKKDDRETHCVLTIDPAQIMERFSRQLVSFPIAIANINGDGERPLPGKHSSSPKFRYWPVAARSGHQHRDRLSSILSGYPDGRLRRRSLGNFNFCSHLTQAMAQLSVLGRSLRTNKTNERLFAARDSIYELDGGNWDTPVEL